MKTFNSFAVAVVLVIAAPFTATAQTQGAGANSAASVKVAGLASAMSEGDVRKIDKDSQKITVKHGEIKNLDMPGMTMVFTATDPAMLDLVKPGDKVMFRAEKAGGALVVTEIRLVK